MPPANAKIQAIYRFPVKGLSGEPLGSTVLEAGQTVPADRIYAIENGPSGFDAAAPAYFPKARFLMLMRNERLAMLETHFDEASHTLLIRHHNREVVRADLRDAKGRAAVESYFAAFCANELRGPPKVLHAPGHSFSDAAKKVVSIINLASVAEVEAAVGLPIDPLRFRANLYVEGWPPWQEFDLLYREIAIGGSAQLRIMERIVRCAATNVDPRSGIRDLTIPDTLMRTFDHADCGVYAEVVAGGPISIGDRINLADS